jgi:hypothetical protein
MATTFKRLTSDDISTTKTRLHEVIPLTGSIVSGTYNAGGLASAVVLGDEYNIKTYGHGMFQSVFDYPYLSSSANHLFDMTIGLWSGGDFKTGSSGGYVVGKMQPLTASEDKHNIYSQFAQLLVGHDHTGNIKPFDHSGAITSSQGEKFHSAIFLNFSRLLVKDEIEKGTFTMVVGTASIFTAPKGPFGTADDGLVYISDFGAATDFKTNSPAGEYGILYRSDSANTAVNADDAIQHNRIGLIYYQAGIVVLEGSSSFATGSIPLWQGRLNPTTAVVSEVTPGAGQPVYTGFVTGSITGVSSSGMGNSSGYLDYEQLMISGTINQACDAIRHRIRNIEFKNTTELNSTVYFCRAGHNEFNYSSNPSYLTGSEIRVKNSNASNHPVTYVTTVGLFSDDGELMATAKLSEPLKKDDTTDFTIRVRLDY